MDVLVVAVVIVGGDFEEEEESVEAVGTPAPFGPEASAAANVVTTLFSVTVAIFLTVEAM